MGKKTRLPSNVIVRAHILSDAGQHRFVVLLARPPQEPSAEAFAELLATPGAAAVYRAFDADVPCDDHDVDRIAAFLNVHRGIAMLGFAREHDAAKCGSLLKERRQ